MSLVGDRCPEPVIHPSVPGRDLNSIDWYDGMCNGPYSLAQVEEVIAKQPILAKQFVYEWFPDWTHEKLWPDGRTKDV